MNKRFGAVLASFVAVGVVLSGCSSDKDDNFVGGDLGVPFEKKTPLPKLPVPDSVDAAAGQLEKFGSVQQRTWPDGTWVAAMRGNVKDDTSQCLMWSFTNEKGKPPVLSSFSKEKSWRVVGKKLYCGVPNLSGALAPGIPLPNDVWDKMSISNPRTVEVSAWNAPVLTEVESLRNSLLSRTPGKDVKSIVEESFPGADSTFSGVKDGVQEFTVKLPRKDLPPAAIEMPGQLPPAITFQNAHDIDINNSFDSTKKLYPVLGLRGKVDFLHNRVTVFPVFRDEDLR